MNDRIREILRKRGKEDILACLDSNCDRVQVLNIGYGVSLCHCRVHAWKEQISGKTEDVGALSLSEVPINEVSIEEGVNG